MLRHWFRGKNISNITNDWPWHFLYLTNFYIFLKGEWIGLLTHFWTLAVEEQFYITWFWIVIFAKTRHLVPITLLVVLIGPLYRAVTYGLGYDKFADILLPGCLDTLGMGCFLAVATHDSTSQYASFLRERVAKNKDKMKYLALGISIVLLYIGYAIDRDHLASRILLNFLSAFLFTWIVYATYKGVSGKLGKVLSNEKLIYIGRISYGVYVYHTLVPPVYGKVIDPRIGKLLVHLPSLQWLQPIIGFVIMVVLTLMIAAISWKFIEYPINKLKARFSEGLGSV